MYPGTFLAGGLQEKGDNRWLFLNLKHWYVCGSWAGTMPAEQIRVNPINREFSGPAERVRLQTCRLIGNYPATVGGWDWIEWGAAIN